MKQFDGYHIYILYDPTLVSQTYYVGYSNDPQERLGKHITQKEENPFKDNWVNKLMGRGIKPVYHLLTSFTSKSMACQAETDLIAFLRAMGVELTNILPGGEEPPHKYGEKVPNASLANEDAYTIRHLFFNEQLPRWELMKRYNVSDTVIERVIKYETYIEGVTIPENLEQLIEARNRADKNRSPLFLSRRHKMKPGDNAGEEGGQAKLKNDDIHEIRRLFDEKRYTNVEIAELFNVNKTTIGRIISRQTWKHI